MNKHLFTLCINKDQFTENEIHKETFVIEQNELHSIVNKDFQARYQFDLVCYYKQYFDSIKHFCCVNKEIDSLITFLVFGGQETGKSTLLRGEHEITNKENESGLILNLTKYIYNQIFDLIENKDQLVILKFGSFLINSIRSNHDINIENLIEQNETTSMFDKKLYLNKQQFVIHHMKSFDHLQSVMSKAIKKKNELLEYSFNNLNDDEYNNNNHEYVLMFQIVVELKNSISLETITQMTINIYEFNIINITLLQRFSSYLNKLNSNEIVMPLERLHFANVRPNVTLQEKIMNVMCMKNLTCVQSDLDILKMNLCLEKECSRNELYINSHELCTHCIQLSNELSQVNNNNEVLLSQIEEMTKEANKIFAIVKGVNKKLNTQTQSKTTKENNLQKQEPKRKPQTKDKNKNKNKTKK